jgi:hypothetical protein
VTLTRHPLLVQWSRKSTCMPLLLLWTVLPVLSLSACTRVQFTFLHGITQRRKKELQPENTYSCWGMTWYDCGQQHSSLSARSFRVCVCCCQVKLKPLSYGFCEQVYRPACRDQDVSRSFSPRVTNDIGVDATAVGTTKARIL